MNRTKKVLRVFIILLILGYLIPQNLQMPVQGATTNDFNSETFWYHPWGKSVTHKGVDIFAKKGTRINSATKGVVLYTGNIQIGGNVVLVLGPKWRFHYYAHMQEIHTQTFSIVNTNTEIGRVGDTGNAKGKPPHLHYSILTPIPYFWKADSDIQGWKKMFILNPIEYLKSIQKKPIIK